MADLLITDIPDEVLDRLAARAARERKTLEDATREALATRPQMIVDASVAL